MGNVVHFFLWIVLLSSSVLSGKSWLDYSGVGLFFSSMDAVQQKVAPSSVHGLQLNPGDTAAPQAFPWNGIQWMQALVAGRLLWFAAAIGIASLAAIFFNYFDPSRVAAGAQPAAPQHGAIQERDQLTLATSSAHLSPFLSRERACSFTVLVLSEWKLMLEGYPDGGPLSPRVSSSPAWPRRPLFLTSCSLQSGSGRCSYGRNWGLRRAAMGPPLLFSLLHFPCGNNSRPFGWRE